MKSKYLDIKNRFSNSNEYLAVVNDDGLWIKEEIDNKMYIIHAEKLKKNEFILLSSAIVQIVYLKIKPYAVVNETVNVSKKINVFPGFINAILKNGVLDLHRKSFKPIATIYSKKIK